MTRTQYVDSDHPDIRRKAAELTSTVTDATAKAARIFNFVRDDIRFGFHEEIDRLTAQEVLERRMGQCNNKTILFVALCRAAGIPARIHYSLIDRRIQWGLFPKALYWLMPRKISHSWAEIELDGRWVPIDSFINDRLFFVGAREKLAHYGLDAGYSVACDNGSASIAFDPRGKEFVQMAVVTDDHGVWDEAADYFMSPQYVNGNVSAIKRIIYTWVLPGVNRRVIAVRARGTQLEGQRLPEVGAS